MSGIAQNVPNEILEFIFKQEVLAATPALIYHGSMARAKAIEADSEISGENWVLQSKALDHGITLAHHPNYTLHRLLTACKAWLPTVQRELYRSITVGFTSQGSNDFEGANLLLRTLSDAPDLASMVQDLTLYLVFPDDGRANRQNFNDQLAVHADILRLCAHLKNVRICGVEGNIPAKENLLDALSSLTSVQSLSLSPAFYPNPGLAPLQTKALGKLGRLCSSRKLLALISGWVEFHTLVLLDAVVYDDEERYATDWETPPLVPDSDFAIDPLPSLQKMCIYNSQPPVRLLRSLATTLPPIQVFRCWTNVWPWLTDEFCSLLGDTLVALAPTLQHLTLMPASRAMGRHPRLLHDILEEESAPKLQQLVELQTSAFFMKPSCFAHLPKLQFLACDTMVRTELEVLKRVVLNHNSLRSLSFYTSIPISNAPYPDYRHGVEEVPEPDEDPWPHILELKASCESRGVIFENRNE
ncbi:hypothetical protein BC629DRAFT_136794 [Irpex lacteus]|nr:hypothetical protein BC629DRAFT_136794 [Irpex lacteus]